MYGPLFSTNRIDERQQETRRATEDGRELYEEMHRFAAQERELGHIPRTSREPFAIGPAIARRLSHIVSRLVSIGVSRHRPTSVDPRARSRAA